MTGAHLSWTSPRPLGKNNEYLLAMLLRIHRNGNKKVDLDVGPTIPPSILQEKDIKFLARNYAFVSDRLSRMRPVETVSDLFSHIVSLASDEDAHLTWLRSHRDKIRDAEAELLEVVEKPGHKGFTVWG